MSRASLISNLPELRRLYGRTGTGRPAGEGDRYKCGKLKPAVSPAAVRRMVDLLRHKAADPIMGTVIGELRLYDSLNNAQVAAAATYATLRGEYDKAMGFPARSAKSPNYQTGRGHAAVPENAASLAYAAHKREQFTAALNSLDNARQRAILDMVVIEDQHPIMSDLPWLSDALTNLARHFRMISGKSTKRE